jgi:poly(3-hydroxybutyrate) depolymerase
MTHLSARGITGWFCFSLIPGLVSPLAAEEIPAAGQEQASLVASVVVAGELLEIPYLLFLPKSYSQEGEAAPLILFLHGAGERGSGGKEIELVKKWGPPRIVEKRRAFPFAVLSATGTQRTALENGPRDRCAEPRSGITQSR